MTKKNWFKNLPIVFLVVAIAFSPSFSAGEISGGRVIEIRVEDILLVIFGLIWIANSLISGRKIIEKPPLFGPILAWLGIGFFSVLSNWILGNIEVSRGFFYLLKEVELFFLYFYLFYHIKSIDSAKLAAKLWILLGVADIILVVYQFISGKGYGAYGANLFRERGPFPSGAFFLILFLNLFNLFLYYHASLNIGKIKKAILFFLILSLITGVISSGSRTSIFGLVIMAVLSLIFYQIIRKGGIKPILIGVLVSIFILGTLSVISEKVPRLRGGLSDPIGSIKVGRALVWRANLKLFPADNVFNILFGLGKSVLLEGEESHSQYVRNFIETGIVGSLVFLFLIFSIIKKAWQGFASGGDSFKIGISAGLLVSTFAMLFISIAAEGFWTVKPNELYWFFAAITMAVLSF